MTKYTVYAIRNLTNGKEYIGVTENYTSRIRAHKWALKNGRHESLKLQIDYNLVGLESFEFTKLQTVNFDNREDAHKLEKQYIVERNSVKHGYNNSFGFDGSSLKKAKKRHKVEVPEKITTIPKQVSKPVASFHPITKEFVKVYPNLTEASEEMGIHPHSVTNAIINMTKINELYWGYINSEQYFDLIKKLS
ncbi:GIY-YIG nuclease family protein [Lysinibacillus xylanilyticus]|uniref:GIY-YIG nuclease family protein n=1 Tax=Lysinibacillus xylanilyticus TaxID=582475 RepID=UPI003CFC435D